MKRLLCLLLVLTAMLSLCACQGNFGSINLKDPVNIPENGVIDKSTIMQIKNENAIAVFVGTSGDFKYEWTVFASTIRDAKTVNLGVQLSKTDNGSIRVVLNQAETFGFSASLAIHLNERWGAQSATARAGENAFATVSVTGSKHTILNVNLDGTVAEFVIQPESFTEEQTPTQNTQPPAPENTTDSTTAPTKPEEETTPATKPTEPEEETVPATKPTEPEEETVPATKPTEPEEETVPATKPTEQEEETSPATKPTEPEGTTNPTKPQEPTQPITEPTKPAENGGKDKYHTDPVPEGKPKPVEPEDQEVDKDTAYTCTFSIECSTILNNLSMLEPEKLEMVPFDGVILSEITVVFHEGESVFDVLQRVCTENKIHMEASWTPMYNSAYIEGIHNLYEFDCGALSGWMYKVNGWYPNYGCSRYQLQDGDVVEWRFTCDLGNDIGGGYAVGG